MGTVVIFQGRSLVLDEGAIVPFATTPKPFVTITGAAANNISGCWHTSNCSKASGCFASLLAISYCFYHFANNSSTTRLIV
ncbi:hypothetical protein CEN41_11620 [Fischerella thermalis CCMEE 5330]|uniref:Uncharacterized protein n=1 Tax=Fischerella thermalis CCMEE 5330 TaxID=2019670 RepID=A0A2N6MAY2_9CYAN|nr:MULTISPECIES: hypothetical protein [Fischerella]PMB43932.1 hypothetical protein CEN41_11620 [Fischerella thermalis CCMEE 5330]BAU05272.1 hypothetical protein FIS3754_11660 [Fischerella sp. NIES-3754]BCX07532.1 MAG: hypothetical protein KatS3mg066_1391 [Fischerella sp.]